MCRCPPDLRRCRCRRPDPTENVVAVAEQCNVVALVAVDEVVAVATKQRVGAIAAENRIVAGATVDRETDQRCKVTGGGNRVVAAAAIDDEVLSRDIDIECRRVGAADIHGSAVCRDDEHVGAVGAVDLRVSVPPLPRSDDVGRLRIEDRGLRPRPPITTEPAVALTENVSFPAPPFMTRCRSRRRRYCRRASGQVDRHIAGIGAAEIVDGNRVGAAKGLECDGLDAVEVHGDVADIAGKANPPTVGGDVDPLVALEPLN